MTGVQTCALRSEEHTSELQSHDNLVCRLLLEKKKNHEYCTHSYRGRAAVRGFTPQCAGAQADNHTRWYRFLRDWLRCVTVLFFFFFFNNPAPPEISPLSLPDALPINDTATTEIYTLSLHDAFRSRWSPYH